MPSQYVLYFVNKDPHISKTAHTGSLLCTWMCGTEIFVAF